jgi:transposase-like protein
MPHSQRRILSRSFAPTLPTWLPRRRDETQALLLSLLASSRSVNAVKDALQKMGLSSSQQELDRVATGLIEKLDLRNSRPLDPDLLALFLDGKYVEFRDGDRLCPACIYVIVGLRRDRRKQVLTCLARHGRENLEDRKAVLRNLIERGLRRLLISRARRFFWATPHHSEPVPQHRRSALCRAYAAQRQNPSPQTRCRRVSTALARY